jgi:hypothetical protein
MKRRLLKIGLWILGSVLGIVLLISGGLYFFKDEICGYVISEVNLHLKAKVKVEKVDLAFWGSFPNLSVDFNNVFIQDSYEKSTKKDTLLYSDRIRLKFNPLDIWNEKYNVKAIDVSPGTIQLKINRKGENNYDILKETKDSTQSKFNLNLEKVNLEKIRFSFKNRKSDHFYSTSISTLELEGAFSEKEFTLHSKSKLHVNFAKSGSINLLTNKSANFDLNIFVNTEKGSFEIPNALIYVANLPFHMNGKIADENLKFRIYSEKLELVDVANNFSNSAIDNVKEFGGEGKVKFDVTIAANTLSSEAPNINCTFGVNNGAITEPSKGLKLNNIFVDGHYSNDGGKAEEYLKLSNVSFSTVGGPFSGEVLLTNFDEPIFDGQAKGNIDLNVAHSLFSFPAVDSISGNIDVNSTFSIQALQRDSINKYDIRKCEGDITLNNVGLKLKEDKRFFNQMVGSIYLRDDEVGLNEIGVKVGQSDLQINGIFKNIVGFLRSENALDASVDIKSDYIDIQDLSTETKAEQISDGKNWILPDNLESEISLNAREIKYENHRFRDFLGEMIVSKHLIEFSKLTVQNAGANVRGILSIEEKTPEIFTISTQLASDNIDFKPLFKEWNNFEQDIIKEDNISGKAHVLLDFTAPFDLKNGVIKNAIKSQIQLKISEGRLKNVSTFKQITENLKSSSVKLILKKANINEFEKKLLDLKFETFENTLIIKNGQLEIPSMTIKSNALDLELFGKHGFDDQIDYHFSFNLRDIRKQKTEDEFGQIEDDKQGIKVFLRMYGNVSDPTIIWDQEAKKEQAKANREEAKKDAKSIFKTEFGMFKNDSTVKTYKEEKKPTEELKIEFGNDKKEGPIEDPKKKKKDSKLGNTLKKWKEEADKDKKEDF